MSALRADGIARLTDPDFLARIIDPIESLERVPMGTPGFSGSTHVRLRVHTAGGIVSLVLKQTTLESDWTCFFTDDSTGREAQILASQELTDIWEIFANPYVAYALEPGRIGLLLHDLEPYLFPDVREPLEPAAEEGVLGRIAALHARYWESPAARLPWLARPRHLLAAVGPCVLENDPGPRFNPHLRQATREGWREAFRRLPRGAAEKLRRPAEDVERAFERLPHTIVHGDVKVANFALMPGGRVAAFDWAMTARAPAGLDLGWYLAVNASRLARPKEAVMNLYRTLLEKELGRALPETAWDELVAVAILTGATTLLWSKALALRDGRPGAQQEWNWWVGGLETLG